MQTSTVYETMAEQGYVRIANLYSPEQLEQLKTESEALIDEFYNLDQLHAHAVYPSDSTETRVSHAVMLSEGPSDLPTVDHLKYPAVDQFLKDHNELLAAITKTPVKPSSRCMLNYQNYFSGSKPVGEHFDGEYLKTQRAGDGVEFKLLEGILPRYVAVLVVANENDGKGIELVDNGSNDVIAPKLYAGDLVIFDNISLRHRVPTLENPRTTIGVRSFDHLPLHFAANESYFLGDEYQEIPEGWVSRSIDCNARMHKYMNEEWPLVKDEYSHYF